MKPTAFMEKNLHSEADSRSVGEETPPSSYGTIVQYHATGSWIHFTSSPFPFLCRAKNLLTSEALCVTFRDKLCSQLPSIYGGRLLHPQSEDAPGRSDRGPI
jgi:hypothetical protein